MAKFDSKVFMARNIFKRNRRKLVKDIKSRCKPIKGVPFSIPCKGAPDVSTYLYRPQGSKSENLPVIFNVHSGSWIGGDALLLDTQSQHLADSFKCAVVNINYKKADEKVLPYAVYEIRDTVEYFAEHAEAIGVNKKKFVLMGYSTGAQLAASAAQMLLAHKTPVCAQVLCYPFLDFTFGDGSQKELQKNWDELALLDKIFFKAIVKEHPLCSPGLETVENLRGLAPAVFVLCGKDPLRIQAEQYIEKLQQAEVPVQVLDYPDAMAGFMDVNYPETTEDPAKNARQEQLCNICEKELHKILKEFWSK